MACSWHSQFSQRKLTDEALELDLGSLQTLVECGINWRAYLDYFRQLKGQRHGRSRTYQYGERVRWDVPGRSGVVLTIRVA